MIDAVAFWFSEIELPTKTIILPVSLQACFQQNSVKNQIWINRILLASLCLRAAKTEGAATLLFRPWSRRFQRYLDQYFNIYKKIKVANCQYLSFNTYNEFPHFISEYETKHLKQCIFTIHDTTGLFCNLLSYLFNYIVLKH